MKTNKLLFFSVILAACLQGVGSDVYAPSLTAMTHSLHTSFGMAKWSMAIYMISLALSHLFYGPLSEGIGRKKPLLLGILIMTLGSFICMLAPTINMLILGRLIQGCGAGACAALWRPIFRDLYSGDELSKLGAKFGIFIVFIISAAPALGGYLEHYFNWRASFIFLAIYSSFTLLSFTLFFKETSQHHHIERLKINYILSTFRQLIIHPLFIGMTVCAFLAFGGLFAWTTLAPILLIHSAHMTPVSYGWTIAIGSGIAYILSMRLNGRFVEKLGADTMVRIGVAIMYISGVLMIACNLYFGLTIAGVVAPALLYIFGSAFIFPNTFAKAFTPFGKIAGYAGALYSGIQVAGGGVLGSVVAHIPNNSPVPLAIIFLVLTSLIVLIYESSKGYQAQAEF
jgi:Bcr/CflA subfamily drug resistance transporter